MTEGGGTGAERARLAAADAGSEAWREWGPYLAERAWGTVREDYSEWGTAWDSFTHDHARSRGAGVRTGRHRRVRRGPVLGGDRRLREVRPHRPVRPADRREPRPRGGHSAPAAHPVVPQHVGVGATRARARAEHPGRRHR